MQIQAYDLLGDVFDAKSSLELKRQLQASDLPLQLPAGATSTICDLHQRPNAEASLSTERLRRKNSTL